MKHLYKFFLPFIALVLSQGVNGQTAIAYSPVIDSLLGLCTFESVSIADRQLSGDTSVLVNGETQSITTRNYQFNAVQQVATAFIRQKFEEYGLQARYQDYSATGRNVLGIKEGFKYPDKKYIICAHYDDMPSSLTAPGADDNASGVVAVMEAARLLAPLESEYTLEFAVWDEEEIGLVGSEAYADSAAQAGMQIMGVLNFDMIAWDSNGDFRMTIGTNSQSAALTNDYEQVMRMYTPEINWNYTDIEASDHSSFWNNGYPAILGIEEYPDDFNAYYHSPEDNFAHVNVPYFHRMVQAAVAGLASVGWNCRMSLQHQQIPSGVDTLDQEAILKVISPKTIGTGDFAPHLYFNINGGPFQSLLPSAVYGNSYAFTIPGQANGTTINYYFAVQDEDAIIIETLPKGGNGINPPGTQAPSSFFTYFIAPNQVQTFCSTTTPRVIPDMSVIYDTIAVGVEGGIKDVDVQLDITHTRVKTLNISLSGPDGTSIDLSSGNGGSGSNFSGTVFDDEAPVSIIAGIPPYTGRFRPEQPLSAFDTRSAHGNWILRIQDSVISQVGSLNSWCLILDYYDLNAQLPEVSPKEEFSLGQNYPNPANHKYTTIPFRLASAGMTELSLFDIYGRMVKILASARFAAGSHQIILQTEGLLPGTYVYRLIFEGQSQNRLLVIKGE
jgi:subtilisin-like proprotein convertase family protein